jgi:acetyltransferase-like isoleucine patch superfamily enzyme
MIKRLVSKFYNKILSFAAEPVQQVDPIDQMVANGNLILGSNCLLQGMVIYGQEFKENQANVIIGHDCHIMGQIELYSPDAKVIIGDRVFVGPQTRIFCRESIIIEDDVMVSWGCTIIDTNAHSLKSSERKDDVISWKKGHQFKDWSVAQTKAVRLKAKCWVGFNTIITKGVTLSEGTVVGCGSVVTKSTKSYSVVGGNPAVHIKDTI